MDPGDRRKRRELLREFRVEFHCARSERVEPRVDSEVHLRKAREVPDDIMLREIRDREVLAPNLRGDEVREVDVRIGGGSLLHEERLVPVGLAEVHRSASRAPSRRPIASGVWRPGVANRAASLSSGSWRVSGNPPWIPFSRRARWTAADPFFLRTTNSLKCG